MPTRSLVVRVEASKVAPAAPRINVRAHDTTTFLLELGKALGAHTAPIPPPHSTHPPTARVRAAAAAASSVRIAARHGQ